MRTNLLLGLAKQIRFAPWREGGEQWNWPINAARKPKLFSYTPCLFSLLAALGSPLEASVAQRADINFDYQAELNLLYVDELSFKELSQTLMQDGQDSEPTITNRSLGLSKAAVQLEWFDPGNARLQLGLRPDAELNERLTDDGSVREVDTRAGQTYRPAPRIDLLDTYAISLTPSRDVSLGWGVFDQLIPRREAYPMVLDFGLDVFLPQKFGAYHLSWIWRPLEAPAITPTVADRYAFHLWLLNGRNDRGEQLAAKEESADSAPSSNDPYTGGAFAFEGYPSASLRLGFLGGYQDTKIQSGRISETYASISADGRMLVGGRRLATHYQLKWAKERWHVDQGRFAQLTQTSHSLSLRYHWAEHMDFLTGFQIGTSQQHDPDDTTQRIVFSGYKVDLGGDYQIVPGLNAQLMIAHEVRQLTQNGQQSGGFQSGQDDERQLNRCAIAISYRVP